MPAVSVRAWLEYPNRWLRHDPAARTWSLYWADSNSRWHPYEPLPASRDLDRLLNEIDGDPTCIFWG